MSYLQAKNQLDTFAGLTAGVAYFPRFEGEIPDIFRSVVGFLRNEYEIGFSPEETSLDGKYHKLKVEIIAPDGRPLKVINKEGKTRKVVVFALRRSSLPHLLLRRSPRPVFLRPPRPSSAAFCRNPIGSCSIWHQL